MSKLQYQDDKDGSVPQTMDDHPSSLITRLPPELLAIIFSLSLPNLDIITIGWASSSFDLYRAALYNIRSVSRQWKALVDNTPSLWRVISSYFPDKVNAATILLSRSSPIIVHYGPFDELDASSSFRDFMQLVTPHKDRWAEVWIELPDDMLNQSFSLPSGSVNALMLQIQIWEDSRDLLPRSQPIEIIGGGLEGIHYVHLDSVAMRWPEVLPSFRSLKTLELRSLHGHGISMQLLLETLALNPKLELLVLADIGAIPLPNIPSSSVSRPIILPHLTKLKLRGGITYMDCILRCIQFKHERIKNVVFSFDIRIPEFNQSAATQFWTETFSTLLPTIRRIYSVSDTSTILLFDTGNCQWVSGSDEDKFNLMLEGLSAEDALRWMRGVLDAVNPQPLPHTHVYLYQGTIKREEVIVVLRSLPGVAFLHGMIMRGGPPGFSVQWLVNALGGSASDEGGEERPSVGFADLKELSLRPWRFGLDEMLPALQRRFAKRSTIPTIPDLYINLATKPTIWLTNSGEPDENQIIEFDIVQQIGAIDGVQGIRLGDSIEHDGMLAVAWNEELCSPVWG